MISKYELESLAADYIDFIVDYDPYEAKDQDIDVETETKKMVHELSNRRTADYKLFLNESIEDMSPDHPDRSRAISLLRRLNSVDERVVAVESTADYTDSEFKPDLNFVKDRYRYDDKYRIVEIRENNLIVPVDDSVFSSRYDAESYAATNPNMTLVSYDELLETLSTDSLGLSDVFLKGGLGRTDDMGGHHF